MDVKKIKNNLTFGKISSLLIIGFGVGWLAGLSVSPIVSTLISTIVGVSVTVVSVMSGLSFSSNIKEESKRVPWKIHPAPIALLVFGIIFGSGAGIYVRTHNVLGMSSEKKFVETWTTLGKSFDKNPIITEEEIVEQLFKNIVLLNENETSLENTQTLASSLRNKSFKQKSFCSQLYRVIEYEEEYRQLVKESEWNEAKKDKFLKAKTEEVRKELVENEC
ncbi:MAG: Unknown protein [uncultured Sulfurovum sp.]|uniref:Uncharacterized protein n=1 Tax=uncultured Sulfurovum sp. TaxID=269237 RepID=A0A6S6T6F1_9BACT|nr:MAG: Unknown protein [uncultured Sulfurovum sp.]